MSARRSFRSFGADARGVTLVEFALVAPLLLLLLTGGLEVGHRAYLAALLRGEINKAGRDLTLEDAQSPARRTEIENRVRAAMRPLARSGTVAFSRRSYRDYANVASTAEDYIDANHDGRCNANEVFSDTNDNGVWDIDGGRVGDGGGAKDVVVFRAEFTYDRLPLGKLLGMSKQTQISATTYLRNQPFDNQAPVAERTCP